MEDYIKIKQEYLLEYEKAVRQMNRSTLKIQEMRMQKMSLPISYDGLQHSQTYRAPSDYAVFLDLEEREYVKYRYRRIKLCKEITDKIEQMDSENEKDILMYRYISLMKWEDICEKMRYSWRQIHYLHNKALLHFDCEYNIV